MRSTLLALTSVAAVAAAASATGQAQSLARLPAGKQLIGHTVRGRPIYAYELGFPGGRVVLVVGCIHGNESAGVAVANTLRRLPTPAGVDLWIVPVLNLDGRAADTHGNAHGVDLNRNFPFDWRRLGGIASISGPHALSEPESRAAYRLILRIRPQLSIWFHQHLAVIDDSQGSVALERRFARLVGLPLAKLIDYPGSVASWENHTFSGTAFVVELHAGRLTPDQAHRYAEAVLSVARRSP